jgi:hypothetical protein
MRLFQRMLRRCREEQRAKPNAKVGARDEDAPGLVET